MNTQTIPNNYFFNIVEEELSQGKNVEFTVKGYSMLPFIRNMKDNVVLYPCHPEDLKVLDFVLFKYKGKHIIHRIVKIEGNRYIMQGDGIYASQEQCDAEEIVGIVRYIIRNGHRISVDNRWYRCYVKTWYHLRFARRYLLFGYRVLTRIGRIF